MANATLSAWVDKPVADAIQDMARSEDRKPSQLAGAALRLYTQLTADSRNALRVVQAHATSEEQQALFAELTRALVRAQLGVTRRMAADDMRRAGHVYGEEDIEAMMTEGRER